jgi:very-short-patch-repair endonuclease
MRKRLTGEEFIKRAKEVHGNKYDYSLVYYVNMTTKVKIIHKEYGIFEQRPQDHLRFGCSKCGYDHVRNTLSKTTEEFIKEAKEVHGDKYDYSLVEYTNNYTKVKIICPTHGVFEQSTSSHLNGCCCPSCSHSTSFSEDYIASFLKYNNITFEKNTRNIISPKEIDLYLPDYKIGIEINGIYWHSQLAGKDRNYHINKTKLCEKKGIRLIHFLDNEIKQRPNTVKSILNSITNMNKRRLYGRKCVIREINNATKISFLEKYHLQGNDTSSIRLGLFHNNKLCMVMTFNRGNISGNNKSYNGYYELSRLCGNNNFYVVGGASKLLKYFERKYKPTTIKTYADKRWSKGDVYHKLGFTHLHDSKPNYWYFHKSNSYKLYHRYNFRKSVLSDKLNNYNPNKTEWENMMLNGWNRIWDCGNMVFEKNYSSSEGVSCC